MLSTLLLPSGLSPAPPFALGVYDSTWYPETPAGPGGPACPAGPRSPLLVWDYRGFGRSAPVTHPYTMADVAADAAGLLAVTGWQSCRVAGVSFGGMVAQLKVADSRWDQRWLNAHPVDRVLAERLTAAGQDQQDPAAAAADAAQLQAREGHDVWDRLGAITCPALVGYGNYDGIAPARNSEKIASRVRGAELHGYEGGHGFLFQDPPALPAFIAFLLAPPVERRSPVV